MILRENTVQIILHASFECVTVNTCIVSRQNTVCVAVKAAESN